MKEAALSETLLDRPDPRVVLELLKPITWFAPMWALLCGVVSSGLPLAGHWPVVLAAVLLAGPLVCGMSQAINDWHDRDVDAINEPDRPIPSGRLPGRWGLYIAALWTVLSLLLGWALGPWVLGATLVALILAWAYSAPPFRLKQNGWWGNAAVGFSYEGIAWFAGATALIGAFPDWRIVALAVLYSLGAHGIMTLNDFKSVEGDSRSGIRSLPVQLGVAGAARVACATMAAPQLVVLALLLSWDQPLAAAGVGLLLLGQLALMLRYLLDQASLRRRPRENAALYNASGTTLYVLGMLVSAFALRALLTAAAA